jgi:lipid-A-disaccharide synthase
MSEPPVPTRLLMVAGERSGDLHGAELAAALAAEAGELEIFGCGGEAMRRAGVETVADVGDFAMVGITEIAGGFGRARRAFHAILAEVDRRRPVLAVLIDSSSLNLRLAKRLKPRGIRVAYYVSPQIWAWKKWRLRHLRRRVDKMLCLFDFEEEIYRRTGIPVEYVGHPLVDRPEIIGPGLGRGEFFAQARLDPAAPLVALLPGSRKIEVAYNLPPIVQAARELAGRRRVQFVLPLAPTLEPAFVEAKLYASGADAGLIRPLAGATHDALRYANVAVVASGTATLEAALLECPMVVVYRVARLTALFARFMVDVPFYSMVNLLAGKRVVPELIQNDFTAERLAPALECLLDHPEVREKMVADYSTVRARLGPGGAARRAARAVAELLSGARAPALART